MQRKIFFSRDFPGRMWFWRSQGLPRICSWRCDIAPTGLHYRASPPEPSFRWSVRAAEAASPSRTAGISSRSPNEPPAPTRRRDPEGGNISTCLPNIRVCPPNESRILVDAASKISRAREVRSRSPPRQDHSLYPSVSATRKRIHESERRVASTSFRLFNPWAKINPLADLTRRIFLRCSLSTPPEFRISSPKFHLEVSDEYKDVTEVSRIFHPPTHNEGRDKGQGSPNSRWDADIPGPSGCGTPAVPDRSRP